MMQEKRVRIGMFVLCYDVESCVRETLLSIPRPVYDRLDTILVIDNHSHDRTVEIVKATIAEAGLSKLTVIENERNYGYGGSHKIAFDVLRETGMDYAVLVHGDGQGDPEALHELVQYCEENRYDFIIGSRFLGTARLADRYPLLRRLGNHVLVCLQAWISGMNISDPGSGEVAYSLPFLAGVPYHRLTDQFHFTPQLLLFCSRMPMTCKEFPIRWGEVRVSSVNMWRHGWNMLRMLLAYRLKGIEGLRELPAGPSASNPSR